MKLCTELNCKEKANNVPLTLCNKHTDELRQRAQAERVARQRALAAEYKYYIPRGEISGVEFADEGQWRSYEVDQVLSNSLSEAVEDLTISEVDQDGGEITCYGFVDAPYDVQTAVATLLNETLDNVLDAAIAARKGNSR
jgi:hypothetical protein